VLDDCSTSGPLQIGSGDDDFEVFERVQKPSLDSRSDFEKSPS